MNKIKYTVILIFIFSFKTTACELCIDSIFINKSKLNLFLSNEKVIDLKLKYRQGDIQAKYKGYRFIVKFDEVYNNAYASSIVKKINDSQNPFYSGRVREPIGYILYDINDHVYFVEMFKHIKLKNESIEIENILNQLCYTKKIKKKLYITIVRAKMV